MIRRIIVAPFRLMLGLPAFYGMTFGNRFQQIGRALGIYRGPIHFTGTCRTLHLGVKPSPLERFLGT